MRDITVQIVTNGNMASNITSTVISLDQIFGYSVQANYTTSGTLGGTLVLQASDDHVETTLGAVITAGNFVNITGSSVTLTVTNSSASYVWNITSSNYRYFRLVYTSTGGDTGTLNAFATIKGF